MELTIQKVRGALEKQNLPIHAKTVSGWIASEKLGFIVDKGREGIVRVSYFGGNPNAMLARAAEIISGIEGVEVKQVEDHRGTCLYANYSRKFIYTQIYGDEAEKYLALEEKS